MKTVQCKNLQIQTYSLHIYTLNRTSLCVHTESHITVCIFTAISALVRSGLTHTGAFEAVEEHLRGESERGLC